MSQKEFAKITDPGLALICLNFIKGFPHRLSLFLKSYEENNLQELDIQSHNLAAADMFGFDNLGNACRKLNRELNSDSPQNIDQMVKDVEFWSRHLISCKEEIEALLDKQITKS